MIRALIIGICVFSVAYGIKGRNDKIMKLLKETHEKQIEAHQIGKSKT